MTRFDNQEIVCIAGVDTTTGECIRPWPYLERKFCQKLKILPGAILQGEFTPKPNCTGPHQEDHNQKKLKFVGPCSSSAFKTALKKGLFNSVGQGFEFSPQVRQKHLPINTLVRRSIITISISPADIEIVETRFNQNQRKIKTHFRDHSDQKFRYFAITDLGFHDYALQHHSQNELDTINAMIHSQKEVYLRIGLSREHKTSDGRNGYWMQVNGIYTFPDYNKDIRCYAPEAGS